MDNTDPISTVIFCGEHEDGNGPTLMEFQPDKTVFTCTLCGQWVATMHKTSTVVTNGLVEW